MKLNAQPRPFASRGRYARFSPGVLTAARFNEGEFEALVADPAVKQALIANTEEAVTRGVFGAPTIFVGDEMHFGQDRLEFVARALAECKKCRMTSP